MLRLFTGFFGRWACFCLKNLRKILRDYHKWIDKEFLEGYLTESSAFGFSKEFFLRNIRLPRIFTIFFLRLFTAFVIWRIIGEDILWN